MKQQNHTSSRASALQITVYAALVCVSIILFAPNSSAAPQVTQDTAATTGVSQQVPSDVRAPSQQDGFYPPLPVPAAPQGGAPGIKVSLPMDNLDPSVPSNTVLFEPVVSTFVDPSLNYIGFQADFTFDSTVIGFASPAAQAAEMTNTNWNVTAEILPNPPTGIRTLRVSAFVNDGLTPLSGSGTLFNLRMLRVSSTPGATSPLVWGLHEVGNDFLFIDSDLDTFSPPQSNGLISITGPTPPPIGPPNPIGPPLPEVTPTPTPDPHDPRPRG